MTASPSPRDTTDSFGEAPHRPADDAEVVYYKGSPQIRGELGKVSLWAIIGVLLIIAPFVYYLLQNEWWPWYVILGLVVLGLILLFIPVLIVRQVRYCISNYRIDYERGLLGKKIDTMELWHVDDINFRQSFFDRLMGVGTIVVFSDDQTTPNLELKGLPNPREIFEKLKQRVISVKRQRGVIKMDVGS
ncbi:MAG TPA: PH domain-containing protein [Tepidisphaeraceae bacterium]|nr:PH domain-containing protein [Tepidisphaeraceae bacterium]